MQSVAKALVAKALVAKALVAKALVAKALVAVLVAYLVVAGAQAPGAEGARARGKPFRSPHKMVEFLADFLELQASTMGPSHLRGITCQWEAAGIQRALSARGLSAHVLEIPPASNVSAGWTSTAMAATPAATANTTVPANTLFLRAKVPDKAMAALGVPGLRALLLGLAERGKPGAPEESAYAEELFLDMGCPVASLVLEAASDLNLFRRPYRWLLLHPRDQGASSASDPESGPASDPASFTPRAALVDSQVTVALPDGGDVHVWELHRPASNTAGVARPVATWRASEFIHHSLLRGDIVRNLMGTAIRTGIALLDSNNSVNHLTDGKEKGLDQLTKTTYTMLLQAYELMNATVSLHLSNSHGYIRNGKFDGLLGDMANGLIEVGGTCTLPVAFRMLALTYLGFNIPMRAVTVFRQPPLAYTDNVFRLPFPDTLWGAALGLVALCCLLAVLALYLEPAEDGAEDHKAPAQMQRLGAGKGAPKAPLRASMSDVFLLAFGAIAQQGSPVEARGVVARMVTFLLFLAVLLLYTCYSASIVVLLQSSSSSIKTLRDLWKSRLEVAVENMPYNVYFITQMGMQGDEVRRGLFHDKIARKGKPHNFINMTEGIRRLQEGLFAFVAIDSPMYGQIQARFEEHEKCDLFEVDNYSPLRHPHLVARRDSPVTHLLKVKLFLQWERGFRNRFILRSLYSKPRCDVQGARFMSVSFVGARNAYYLITGGTAASILVMFVEMLHARVSARNKVHQADQDQEEKPASGILPVEPDHESGSRASMLVASSAEMGA